MFRPLLKELRDFLASEALTILTAILLVALLHDQVLEAYPVPTRSMEPTIEGDELHGDRILVDKTWDNRSDPERFDMVVFWREEERKTVVKRIAGLPGETIWIRDGDLFVGRSPKDLDRVIKLPGRDSDLRARRWHSLFEPGYEPSWRLRKENLTFPSEGVLEIRGPGIGEAGLFQVKSDGSPSSIWPMTFARRITTGYLDAFGELQEGSLLARDFGVELVFRAEEGTTLWIRLRFGLRAFLLSWQGKGKGRLWRTGAGETESSLGPSRGFDLPGFSMDLSRNLVFMYMDGGFCLALDGEDLFRVPVPHHEIGPYAKNGLSIAATKGRIRIEKLSIVHDFHYLSEGDHAVFEPFEIPPDQYFVLGDNSKDSSDSRMIGSIRKGDIRGRPWIRVSPIERFQIYRR